VWLNREKLLENNYSFMHAYRNFLTENYSEDEGAMMNYVYNDQTVKKNRPYYPMDWIFPLTKVQFETHAFSAPNKVSDYLTILYGAQFIQPPPKDQQVAHFKKLYACSLPKHKILAFLTQFYRLGIWNVSTNNLSKIPKRRKISGIQLLLSLLLKGQFLMAQSFVRFFKLQ
jgi:hypothetical protein